MPKNKPYRFTGRTRKVARPTRAATTQDYHDLLDSMNHRKTKPGKGRNRGQGPLGMAVRRRKSSY